MPRTSRTKKKAGKAPVGLAKAMRSQVAKVNKKSSETPLPENSAKKVELKNAQSVKRKSDPNPTDNVKENAKQAKLMQLAQTAPYAMSKDLSQSKARSRAKMLQKEIVHATFTEDENHFGHEHRCRCR